MPHLVIALGSNIEPRYQNLKFAMDELKKSFTFIKASRIYESDPVDYLDQGKFLNMVAQFEIPPDNPEEILEQLQLIEKNMKRHKVIDKGPRNIDLDIIFVGETKLRSGSLNIPHLSWKERNFVVFPLLDLNLDLDLMQKIDLFSKELSRPRVTEYTV